MRPLIFSSIVLLLCGAVIAESYSDFAFFDKDDHNNCSGELGSSPHDDPNAISGKPARWCQNMPGPQGSGPFRVKIVEGAYNVDLSGEKVLTTIYPDANIVVKFDHKVVDYPGNLYGIDLIVFGNAVFQGTGGYADDTTNLNNFMLSGGTIFEAIEVAVSQDGITFYPFDAGPYADAAFPTQAFVWDRDGAQWTDVEMDFTRPVDPNLSIVDFTGISAADAIDLYDGSGGGTGYDLRNLTNYNDLAVDEESGYRWIQYVKLQGVNGYSGEVDAVADAAACGDPTHPYPVGDVDKNCRVDFADMAMMTSHWLECTYGCD